MKRFDRTVMRGYTSAAVIFLAVETVAQHQDDEPRGEGARRVLNPWEFVRHQHEARLAAHLRFRDVAALVGVQPGNGSSGFEPKSAGVRRNPTLPASLPLATLPTSDSSVGRRATVEGRLTPRSGPGWTLTRSPPCSAVTASASINFLTSTPAFGVTTRSISGCDETDINPPVPHEI